MSQLITPQGTHLISWEAYYNNLTGRRDPGRPHLWYLDIQRQATVPFSNNRLLDNYTTPSTTKNWLIILDDYGSSLFGKQLSIQPGSGTCFIVHWVSPNCDSLPGNLIKLSPCPGCEAHTPMPFFKKRLLN